MLAKITKTLSDFIIKNKNMLGVLRIKMNGLKVGRLIYFTNFKNFNLKSTFFLKSFPPFFRKDKIIKIEH